MSKFGFLKEFQQKPEELSGSIGEMLDGIIRDCEDPENKYRFGSFCEGILAKAKCEEVDVAEGVRAVLRAVGMNLRGARSRQRQG